MESSNTALPDGRKIPKEGKEIIYLRGSWMRDGRRLFHVTNVPNGSKTRFG